VRRLKLVLRCIAALMIATVSLTASAAGYPLLDAQAPDFALRAFAGDNIRLSEHRGEVVVLTFWSTTCTTCAAELQALGRSYVTYRSAGLQMFGVSVDDDQVRARDFAGSHHVAFAMLADPQKSVSRLYQVDNLPMTILIDRGGTVRQVMRDFGPKSEALYLQQLRELLNE
jgi:peroxiredoxin